MTCIAAPMKSACRKVKQGLDQALGLPTSLQEIMKMRGHGEGEHNKPSAQFPQDNLVSSTKEGPKKCQDWKVGDRSVKKN